MGPITTALLVVFALSFLGAFFGQKGRKRERDNLRNLARNNKHALARNLAGCTDEYGAIDSKRWKQQADRFMRSVAFKPRKIPRSEARKIVTVIAQAELNYGHL